MKTIPYSRQKIDEKDIRSVVRALSSDWLTQGPKVREFEDALCKYTGAKYAVCVSSGTAALHLACLAAGVKKPDEIITSPITFVASANCALYCGARPVFADIDPDTACIDPVSVKNSISDRTRAIIPVHFGGHPCDMEAIARIAKTRKIIIIEDACHALGAVYKRCRVGSNKYSDMTVFSFHAVKHITTGEGGAVLTNSKKMYQSLIQLRSHGITRDGLLMSNVEGPWYYEMQALGYNYRITDFQCALGIEQLKRIGGFLDRRRRIAASYDSAFSRIKQVRFLKVNNDVLSARHLYILCFNLKMMRASRKAIFNEYQKNGIGVNVHYIPVYIQPFYAQLGYRKGLCPRSEQYYKEAITLPLYPAMSDRDVRKVIEVTKMIVNKLRCRSGRVSGQDVIKEC